MIKKIILLGLVLTTVYVLLNQGIEYAVERSISKITQTETTLESAKLSIFKSQLTLRDLKIANPNGFQSNHLFALNEIELRVNLRSLFGDEILVEEAIIKKPEINYEGTLTGSNVKQLIEDIKTSDSSGSASRSDPEDETDTEREKQLVIKKLVIEDGEIHLEAHNTRKIIPLARIEMYNIGKNRDPVSTIDAVSQILNDLLKAMAKPLSEGGRFLKESGEATLKSASGQVDAATSAVVEILTEGFKDLLGN